MPTSRRKAGRRLWGGWTGTSNTPFDMQTKAFNIVTALSLVLTLTAAALSLIGIVITGFYNGIVVLCLLVLIPLVSRHYARKSAGRSPGFQRNYLALLTIINGLTILVVLWMAFVILVDRVFPIVL